VIRRLRLLITSKIFKYFYFILLMVNFSSEDKRWYKYLRYLVLFFGVFFPVIFLLGLFISGFRSPMSFEVYLLELFSAILFAFVGIVFFFLRVGSYRIFQSGIAFVASALIVLGMGRNAGGVHISGDVLVFSSKGIFGVWFAGIIFIVGLILLFLGLSSKRHKT
jgi:hypothetical protein